MINREELERLHEAAKPWANFHGDLPDYDHPLRCVYESGIQYAVELLATILKVDDYEVCDGTEEFDGDLGGTLFNIVLAAMPKDDHGDPIYPSELRATLAAENAALTAKVERLEGVLDRIKRMDGVTDPGRSTAIWLASIASAALNEEG